MRKFRALAMVVCGRLRVPVIRVFSLYVVQAGSAAREVREGLPRQRSTGLVRSSGRPGESCPGLAARLILNEMAGSLSPSSGGWSRAPWRVRDKLWSGCLRLVTENMPGARRRRRRWRDPSWCRSRPWSRSSAAGRRHTPPGPWRDAPGLRRPPR